MCIRNTKSLISILLVAALCALPLLGCSGGTKTSPQGSQENASANDGFGLRPLQFHDIIIEVPDTLVGDDNSWGSADQFNLFLADDAEGRPAFSMYLFANDGISYTARSAYEGVAEFEDDAELVEVNGIEFLVERERHNEYNTTSIMLTLDDTGYSIYVDCKAGLGPYEKYVNDICWYISFAETSQPSDTSSIPAGAISWENAQSHIGENVTVYGPVVSTNYATEANSRPTYLDIGVAYPDKSGVSVVIWGEDRAAFDGAPESIYQGKSICVTGEPYMYNEQCYIKVTSPSQIQVL